MMIMYVDNIKADEILWSSEQFLYLGLIVPLPYIEFTYVDHILITIYKL